MISAREALGLLREGNGRSSPSRAERTRRRDAAQRAHRAAGAVRDHPRLLRLARAGRDRVRSGARRPVRHPRGRQHRRAVAGRQRRVRGRAVPHAAGRRARPLGLRRHHGHDRGAEASRENNRATCAPSSIASARPWSRCSPRALATIRRRWCARPSAPMSGRRPTTCVTAPSCSSSSSPRDGLLVVGAEYSLETGVVEFFEGCRP